MKADFEPGKVQDVPGYTNHTWFRISKPGTYPGQCAQLCGRSHAAMTALVHVVSPSDYQAWLREPRPALPGAMPRERHVPAGAAV